MRTIRSGFLPTRGVAFAAIVRLGPGRFVRFVSDPTLGSQVILRLRACDNVAFLVQESGFPPVSPDYICDVLPSVTLWG